LFSLLFTTLSQREREWSDLFITYLKPPNPLSLWERAVKHQLNNYLQLRVRVA